MRKYYVAARYLRVADIANFFIISCVATLALRCCSREVKFKSLALIAIFIYINFGHPRLFFLGLATVSYNYETEAVLSCKVPSLT